MMQHCGKLLDRGMLHRVLGLSFKNLWYQIVLECVYDQGLKHRNKETHSLMSKHTRRVLSFVIHAGLQVKSYCYIFNYFSLIFYLVLICETFFTYYLFCKKKQLGHEPTPIELYKEAHIRKGNRMGGVKIFVDSRAKTFIVSFFMVIIVLLIFICIINKNLGL